MIRMKKTIILCISLLLANPIIGQKNYSVRNSSSLNHVRYDVGSDNNYIGSIPDLTITNFQFIDENNDGILGVNEKASLSFSIKNSGESKASSVLMIITINNLSFRGIVIEKEKELGDYNPGEKKAVNIQIAGKPDLMDGVVDIQIDLWYQNDVLFKTIELELPTKGYFEPNIKTLKYSKTVVADAAFSLSKSGYVESGEAIISHFLIQNIGNEEGSNIGVEVLLLDSKSKRILKKDVFSIGQLLSKESIEIKYPILINNKPESSDLDIHVMISEKNNLYPENYYVKLSLSDSFPANDEINLVPLVLCENDPNLKPEISGAIISENIPTSFLKSPNRFAIIIGNEDYNSPGYNNKNIYSENNAALFKEYAIKTLGLKEERVIFLTNATVRQMKTSQELYVKILKRISGGELVFYYSGKGFIDKETSSVFIPGVDSDFSNISESIDLMGFLNELSNAGSNIIVAFIETDIVNGIEKEEKDNNEFISIKPNELPSKLILFNASKPGFPVFKHPETNLGLFTYYLLKKLQDTKGRIRYSDLGEYLQQTVSVESLVKIKKEQDPVILIGDDAKKWFRTKALIQY